MLKKIWCKTFLDVIFITRCVCVSTRVFAGEYTGRVDKKIKILCTLATSETYIYFQLLEKFSSVESPYNKFTLCLKIKVLKIHKMDEKIFILMKKNLTIITFLHLKS